MKNNITIITEGKFDAEVLEKLLRAKSYKSDFEIIAANGFSSALSKVKTYLSTKNKHILLILDSDTISETDISEKKDFVNTYINTKLYHKRLKIVWAIPEFDVIFLNNKEFLKELTNKNYSDDLIEIGKAAPKKTLEKLSNKKHDSFISFFDNKNVNNEFYNDELIKTIEEYLQKSSIL